MNSKEWIKSLGIPQNAVIDRNLPKQAFYQNADLSLSEKEIIQVIQKKDERYPLLLVLEE